MKFFIARKIVSPFPFYKRKEGVGSPKNSTDRKDVKMLDHSGLIVFCLLVLTSCHTRKVSTGMNVIPSKNNQTVQNSSNLSYNEKPISARQHLTNPQYQSLVDTYIATYSPVAVREMNQYGVPASIILAQAMHESAVGRSSLATQANNHFGVKCTLDWIGPGFYMNDDKPNECFRKYDSPLESFQDHMNFLQRKRYANLFTQFDSKDYKGWAYGLKQYGYATNPQYPQVLIGLIEKYNLHRFDGANQNMVNRSSPLSGKTLSSDIPSHNDGSLVSIGKANTITHSSSLIIYDTIHQKVIKVDTIYTYAYQKNIGNKGVSSVSPSFNKPDSNQELRRNIDSASFRVDLHRISDQNNDPSFYKVHQGDTLYGISKKFNISLDDLRSLNNLPDNSIKIDQLLKVIR